VHHAAGENLLDVTRWLPSYGARRSVEALRLAASYARMSKKNHILLLNDYNNLHAAAVYSQLPTAAHLQYLIYNQLHRPR